MGPPSMVFPVSKAGPVHHVRVAMRIHEEGEGARALDWVEEGVLMNDGGGGTPGWRHRMACGYAARRARGKTAAT